MNDPATQPGATEVSGGIVTAKLEDWLARHVPGYRGPARSSQFEGGQSNPTYKLTAASGEYVLRRKPMGLLLASAHAVDREFRVQSALASTAVPVAKVHALCEDDAVIGSAFYVMDFVPGRIMWNQLLPGATPEVRAAMFDSMNQTIADLHSVNPQSVGLGDFGRPGNYLARQISRWTKQYRASETTPIPAMDRLIEFLPSRIPAHEQVAIVHGDYRIDNVIYHPSEPRVIAVLDWELSTLGDPLVDFAYHTMQWRFTPALFRGFDGEDLPALGIPSEQDYVAAYCRRTGRDGIEDWEYYLVFGMFRIAAILQGITKRAQEGTAASAEAVAVGAKAGAIAKQAWALAQTIP